MKFLWHMSRHYWEKAMERIADSDFVRNFKNVHSKFFKDRAGGKGAKGFKGGGRHEENKRKRLYGRSEGRIRPQDFFRMAAEEDSTDDE